MKRVLSLISAVLVCTLLFSACKGEKTPIDEPEIPTTSATDYSEPTETPTEPQPSTTTTYRMPQQEVDTSIATITGDDVVNIRSGPGTSYDKVGTAYYGETYHILGYKDNGKGTLWYQLDLGNGKSGYVSVNMISIPVRVDYTSDPDDEKYKDVPHNHLVITGDYTVNVRSGPGAGYDKVGTAKLNEHYPVLGYKENESGIIWYNIDLGDGKTGYISSNMAATPDIDSNLSGKKAYLTFDDGPSKFTKQILDTLDLYGVKATWFVIRHKDCDNLYKEIVNRGSTLALHSYTHDYATIYKSETGFFNDLKKIDDFVYNITGTRSKIFRFPGGSSNTVSKKYCKGIMKKLTKSIEEKGYVYFDWNVNSGDAYSTKHNAEQIIKDVKKGCKDKPVVNILMHDTKYKDSTVAALPYIIEYLQSQHYEILPLTEDSFNAHQEVNN